MNRSDYPVYELQAALRAAAVPGCRIIIRAPTGSGKSTQIPQMLLDGPGGQIVVLQPRRIAARLLAHRVASERGGDVGGEIGYQVRFENHTGPRTRIRYVTEGVLLRQWIDDPELAAVSTVIFDEFHERHLYGDISLSAALRLQQTSRPDLRIIVMSATLDSARLQEHLAPCRVLESEGRVYPVAVEYLPRAVDFRKTAVWDAAAEAFGRLADGGLEGHVLIFMPGAYEIRKTIEMLQSHPRARGLAVLPLHGQLSPRAQDEAVSESGRPRIIVATNVAETSITIAGVTAVIDSGLARMARYDPHRGIDTLYVEKISCASADQRSGRAGRTGPGRCLRLWTAQEHAQRPLQETPEILRVDLAEVVLMLKSCGIDDVRGFPWLDSPGEKALEQAETLLHDLGALGRDGRLQPMGRRMVRFPVHPRYSRMLLTANDYECVRQAALIAALTQGPPILLRNAGKPVAEKREELFGDEFSSDFFLLMKAWKYAETKNYSPGACQALGIHGVSARQVQPLYERFLKIAEQEGLAINDRAPEDECICRAILAAFSDNLALRCNRGTLRCSLTHQRTGVLARESVLRDQRMFTAAEITEVEGARREKNVLLSMATAVEEEWLEELFPGDCETRTEARFDTVLKRVVSTERRMFRDLVLSEKSSHMVDPEAAGKILAEEILAGRIRPGSWDGAVDEWVVRVNCLARWCPDWELPAYDDEAWRCILQQYCLGAGSMKDLKTRKLLPVVKRWLSPVQQQMVSQHCPERVQLPSGRSIRLRYAEGAAPVLSATIQDLYGLEASPEIAGGRQKVSIEVLAPNRRPQQVTDDMRSFWTETYPILKKELRGRYPRHEWR
ncbi:MAG TPA: ATP-dependent helicase HrpB [Kiritimatiellia bacterium]|nr:ATP-dependent helicase HrpB [Kiritimatiellia bacterium]HQQ04418.1 ATP-dependent helicase HrpB [Kiritimatiellia bacterium]